MTQFVAFLRAVNVGGTGKLPMEDLRVLCKDAGFLNVRTYIASGNVVFSSDGSAKSVKADLEATLKRYAGRDVGVIIRTAAEMQKVLEKNPFPDRRPNYTMAVFLDEKPEDTAIADVSGQIDEELVLGDREIYVYYASGMGKSRLRIPAAKAGTARNMNTIRKMAELSANAQ